ncbi:MAG: hypothetical protein RLZZ329_2336, partial [Pseudomonadota bacterium]
MSLHALPEVALRHLLEDSGHITQHVLEGVHGVGGLCHGGFVLALGIGLHALREVAVFQGRHHLDQAAGGALNGIGRVVHSEFHVGQIAF